MQENIFLFFGEGKYVIKDDCSDISRVPKHVADKRPAFSFSSHTPLSFSEAEVRALVKERQKKNNHNLSEFAFVCRVASRNTVPVLQQKTIFIRPSVCKKYIIKLYSLSHKVWL